MINCKQNTCMVTKLEIWIQDYLGPVQWSSDSFTHCRKELEPDEAVSNRTLLQPTFFCSLLTAQGN